MYLSKFVPFPIFLHIPQNNRISRLSGLDKLKKLKKLYLTKNRIQVFEGLTTNKHLEEVSLPGLAILRLINFPGAHRSTTPKTRRAFRVGSSMLPSSLVLSAAFKHRLHPDPGSLRCLCGIFWTFIGNLFSRSGAHVPALLPWRIRKPPLLPSPGWYWRYIIFFCVWISKTNIYIFHWSTRFSLLYRISPCSSPSTSGRTRRLWSFRCTGPRWS